MIHHAERFALPAAVWVAGAVGTVALPDPVNLGVFLATVGIGAGLGVGGGVAAYYTRVKPVKVDYLRALDEAHRKTTLYELEQARARLDEATGRIDAGARERDEIRAELAALRDQLDAERARSSRFLIDLTELAMSVLQKAGHVDRPGGRDAVPPG